MNLDNIRMETRRLREDNENLKKRINLKVDAMYEKTEAQYLELQKKKELTSSNKRKFEDTILELDDLKNKEIQKTW
jgi:chromosome segregation ATPase